VQDSSSKLLSLADGLLLEPYVKTFVLGWSVATQRQFYYLTESVATGKAVGLTSTFGNFDSLYTARAAIPDIARYWDPWMQQFNADLEMKVAPLFTNTAHRRRVDVLDWCGNTGGNAIRISNAYANTRITMLDLPEQCEKADAEIAKYGLQDRIQTLPMNLLSPNLSLGDGQFDAVYMIHTIREWSYESLARFFSALYFALRPKGTILMDMLTGHQHGIYNANYVDPFPAYFLASASHEQSDKFYGDVIDLLTDIGFQQFRFTRGDMYLDHWRDGANLLAIK